MRLFEISEDTFVGMFMGMLIVIVGAGVVGTLWSEENAEHKLHGSQMADCALACGTDLLIAHTPVYCQCAESGKNGKVYYAKPEGKVE